MGIPAYFSYLIKNYNSIIDKINSLKKVNNFYLDSNSIIYDALYSIEFNTNNYEDEVIKYTCQKIEYYIRQIKPDNLVYIAFDGVAPVAKLEQQRTRRYKSQLNEKINKEIKQDYKESFDRCAITPGTNFMKKLNSYVSKYFHNQNSFNVKNIVVSGSNVPGEGEHKIFDYIRNNKTSDISVIYGLDADLIMLTLNHLKHNDNLYLFRETPEFIKSIDKSLNPNELYLLNIPELKKIIQNHFLNKIKNNYICENYIFLCFFLGNDFLPHFPCLNIRTNGIKNLNEVYVEIVKGKNLVTNDGLNWKEIRNFIFELSLQEEELLIEEYAIRSKLKKRHFNPDDPKYLEERMNNIPILDMSGEEYIDPYRPGWQHRYYDKLFHIEYKKDNIKEICINYLEGLEWTFKYYNKGCPNWNWYYKYHYPPLLEDLIKYIPAFDMELIENNNTKPIHEITQLSYVLPKRSLHLLPKNIQKFLLDNYEFLYGEDFRLLWDYCRYFWESHVDLPQVDIIKFNNQLAFKI